MMIILFVYKILPLLQTLVENIGLVGRLSLPANKKPSQLTPKGSCQKNNYILRGHVHKAQISSSAPRRR